ncbi:hypothetical protein K7X08_011790 [Anisodus acutangulus]|uniref:Chlorophyll(Ide) b reductase NYC1, chloroplastic n=1 Tax=Anisodus acutangulus TaxID=402998 RepID=A0A9Q1MP55_9SOLA|nr:hypothetical protein K7X08_011790 [Anisodus acutangulus]
MVAKVHVSTLECQHYFHRSNRGHPVPPRNVVTRWDPLIVKGRRRIVVQPFRSFKSEDVKRSYREFGGQIILVGVICWKIYHHDDEHRCCHVRWISVVSQMNELIWYSWLGGIIIGTMIGSNLVLDEVARVGPRNVVITTRGLGKALAREFLLSGDRVIVASRSPESVDLTIKELEENLKQAVNASTGSARKKLAHAKVVGMACDVSEPVDGRKLGKFAADELGYVDIWVNNAGTNKGFRPLLQFTDNDIQEIVFTNLIGSILCTKEAIQIMKTQSKGGHVFNMDGAGSGGSSTPLTAVYGSTKCGMVLTDLLLSGSTIQNRQMLFNIICEHPETVARTLVPRMRAVKGSGRAINYLTPPRILIALVTAWLRRGRWFNNQSTVCCRGRSTA